MASMINSSLQTAEVGRGEGGEEGQTPHWLQLLYIVLLSSAGPELSKYLLSSPGLTADWSK